MNFYSQKNKLNQRKAGDTSSNFVNTENLQKNGFKRYEDPTGIFSNWQLKFSVWYTKHRVLVYRIAVVILIIFSSITIFYSLFKIAWIVIVEVPRDKKILEQLTYSPNYQQLNAVLAPQSLLVGDVQVFSSGVNKYDLMAEVTNPNQKHIVYFDYHFIVNGLPTIKRNMFILPLQTKPLVEVGLVEALGAQLIIDNISYKRINAHLYPDPINFILSRELFSVDNFEFKSVLHPEGANANIIRFTLSNDSPFHYYDPEFIVQFKNNGATVGVATVKLENFASLQKKEIDLRSFADNLFVDEVAIYPSINYFDLGAYFEPIR